MKEYYDLLEKILKAITYGKRTGVELV